MFVFLFPLFSLHLLEGPADDPKDGPLQENVGSDKEEGEDESDEGDEEERHLDNQLRDASVAYESVGWAWCFKSPSRRNFLRHFLETGAVMDTSLKSYPQIRVKMDFLDMSLDSTTGLCAVMSRLRN